MDTENIPPQPVVERGAIALLPCPFCGGEARLIERDIDLWDVGCSTSHCYLELGADWHFPDQWRVVNMWNTRTALNATETPNPDSVRELVEALESLRAKVTERHRQGTYNGVNTWGLNLSALEANKLASVFGLFPNQRDLIAALAKVEVDGKGE